MAIDLSKLPPGPKPVIPLSNFIRFRRDSLGFLKKAAQEYGDVVYFKVGPLRMVLLNHPDFAKLDLLPFRRALIARAPARSTDRTTGLPEKPRR